ncbi:MAG: 5-(carboxyamino)imidazole ribonucleotide mutase, partial [Candidatus Thorarchaeota archaeon]
MVDVLIIAGSKSDEAVVEKAAQVLKELKIEYTVEYASAHREPDRVRSIVESSDARVIIAIAGLSAALPGFISSLTTRPVIGVPVSAALGGLDALLSIVQMPKGVPVATVGIDNGANAAHLAARILNVTQADRTVPRTYAEAGVDTARVAQTHRLLGEYVRRSFEGHGVVEDFGHYANVVRVSPDLSVALTTDGVGSKVLLAQDMNRYDTIGQDCVAMNVNDLICVGADPIGFVDYLACDRPLPEAVIRQIAEGLLEGCKAADIPILGGETAILPELIHSRGSGNFDLAGAAMGIVHPDRIIDGSRIDDGDVILGVASTGLHSNGYTLARKVLGRRHSWREQTDWGTVLG